MPDPRTPVRQPTSAASHPNEAEPAQSESALLDLAVSSSPIVFAMGEIVTGERSVTRLHFVSSNAETLTGHRLTDLLKGAEYVRAFVHADDLEDYDRAFGALLVDGRATRERPAPSRCSRASARPAASARACAGASPATPWQ